jgi:type II secretory pathway pseudopilin PulG
VLELTVALAVIGLILTLAMPRLNRITPRWRLRAAAQQVAATVQWARNAAALSGRRVRVLYDVPEGQFWVEDEQGEARAFHQLPGGVRFEWVKFGFMTVQQDVAACFAYPDGTVTDHEILLVNEDYSVIRMRFSPLTGEPSYEEAHASQL